MGEQADYELDRILAGPLWDDEELYWSPQPLRPGVKAPELVHADPNDFPDLT